MPNISGNAIDSKIGSYVGANNQKIPLLSSFHFQFFADHPDDPETSLPSENKIQTIEILPGGSYRDLSPNITPIPAAIANDKISIAFRDKNPTDVNSDKYSYYLEHILKSNAQAKRFRIRANGIRAVHTQELPPPPSKGEGFNEGHVFVLCGFKLKFTGNIDNRIDAIGVYEDAGRLTVEFNDRTSLDLFDYIVDYAWVSRTNQRVVLGEESGSGVPGLVLTDVKGKKLIRGFRFDFKQGDYKLQRVGIKTLENGLSIYFGDVHHTSTEPNQPEPHYDYMIRWATINDFVITNQ
jgi:hypothetical protein